MGNICSCMGIRKQKNMEKYPERLTHKNIRILKYISYYNKYTNDY